MDSLALFNAVGIRSNGERFVISQHETRDVADRIVKILLYGSAYDRRCDRLPIKTNGKPVDRESRR